MAVRLLGAVILLRWKLPAWRITMTWWML
jgi:hypothetical protein